jgi:flagella basal body P-ring formation protein FlgA
VVIRRSGQAVPIARLEASLAPALAAAGAPSRPVITLINTQSPMIPPGTQPTITTTDLQFNPSNDHFSATLVITAPGMSLEPISVDGSALPGISVVIATHTLQPGELITGADIIKARVVRANVPARPVRTLASVVGMQVQRAINAHEPLSRRALASPLLVRKGALVELVLHMPGITISAHGVALASGSAGDVIAVLNPNSQAVLQAIVRGPDRADVVPGSVATHQQHPNPYYHAAEVR